MPFKLSHYHIFLLILLWLSLMFLLFHEYHHFKSKINKNIQIMQQPNDHRSLLKSPSHHQKQKKQHHLISRKVLASKFDFSPFFKHHHHHQNSPDPSDTQIDPRYGVEKRRVPTGPNPLHH